MAQGTVILEWTFTPPNYLEESIEDRQDDYVLTIGCGKAEARIDADVFDRNPAIERILHDGLNDRFLAAQLVTYKPYTLSRPGMIRVDPQGNQNIFVQVSLHCSLSVGAAGVVVTDEGGNVVTDTRRERIEKKKILAALIQKHRATDTLLDSMLKSHRAAIEDPANELVHLYEIRDALVKGFGSERKVRHRLGITRDEWSRFGKLANDEPVRQGRHRGKNAGNLRGATEEELQEARDTAKKMIEAYLTSLESKRVASPGS